MLSGVSVSCFLLSYLVVFGMEIARIGFKYPGRHLLVIVMMAAGLFAHTIFLGNELWKTSDSTGLLSTWFHWLVLGAWGAALFSMVLMIRKPEGSTGLFMVPTIMGLIGLATLTRGAEPFSRVEAVTIWQLAHGVSLLLGTMFIVLGFGFGVMYLMKSRWLKTKKQRLSRRFGMPALEFIQTMNRYCLMATTMALGAGLLSGVLLNLIRDGQVAWLSTGVLVSFLLFGVSLVGAAAEYGIGGKTLGGRRSAYLTIANFLVMLFVVSSLLIASHGQTTKGTEAADQSQVSEVED